MVSTGKYSTATVAYKDGNGKIEGKKVMSFGPSADVFKVVSQAQPGDLFDVKSEKIAGKEGKEYWNWTAIETTGKNVGQGSQKGQTSGSATPTRSTYETPEERAKKQVYIVRQSSLSVALELHKHNNPKAAIDFASVVETAQGFEDFVFNGVDEAEQALKAIEVD